MIPVPAWLFALLILGLPLVGAVVLAMGGLFFFRAARGECPIPSPKEVAKALTPDATDDDEDDAEDENDEERPTGAKLPAPRL